MRLAPRATPSPMNSREASLVILNTCHIREKAAEKVYSELGRIRRMQEARRRAGRDLVIAVAGCVAQAEGEEMARRAPAIGIVVGPQSYQRLPLLLKEHARTGKTVVETEFEAEAKFDALPAPKLRTAPSAFLTVQEGCDKFCTFCVVPYTRGGEYSRPAAEILDEARKLIDGGAAEINAPGPERECLSRGGAFGRQVAAAGPSGRAFGPARAHAAALHHKPSQRHDRQPDRGAPRSAQAHALSPSAVPGGFRQDFAGDEPQARHGRLFPHRRRASRGAARYRAFHRHYCGLPRRDGGGLPGDDAHGGDRGLRAGLLL